MGCGDPRGLRHNPLVEAPSLKSQPPCGLRAGYRHFLQKRLLSPAALSHQICPNQHLTRSAVKADLGTRLADMKALKDQLEETRRTLYTEIGRLLASTDECKAWSDFTAERLKTNSKCLSTRSKRILDLSLILDRFSVRRGFIRVVTTHMPMRALFSLLIVTSCALVRHLRCRGPMLLSGPGIESVADAVESTLLDEEAALSQHGEQLAGMNADALDMARTLKACVRQIDEDLEDKADAEALDVHALTIGTASTSLGNFRDTMVHRPATAADPGTWKTFSMREMDQGQQEVAQSQQLGIDIDATLDQIGQSIATHHDRVNQALARRVQEYDSSMNTNSSRVGACRDEIRSQEQSLDALQTHINVSFHGWLALRHLCMTHPCRRSYLSGTPALAAGLLADGRRVLARAIEGPLCHGPPGLWTGRTLLPLSHC